MPMDKDRARAAIAALVESYRALPPAPADAAQHDALVALVERMLDLKRQHAAEAALFSERRHALADQIAHTDAEIDRRVCALYGLTDAEAALVLAPAPEPVRTTR